MVRGDIVIPCDRADQDYYRGNEICTSVLSQKNLYCKLLNLKRSYSGSFVSCNISAGVR